MKLNHYAFLVKILSWLGGLEPKTSAAFLTKLGHTYICGMVRRGELHMSTKPRGREAYKEFIVYLPEEVRNKLAASLKDVGWTRHEFFEEIIAEWLLVYEKEFAGG